MNGTIGNLFETSAAAAADIGGRSGMMEGLKLRDFGGTVGEITVANPRMRTRDVNVHYGDKHAIKNVSLDIGSNEVIARPLGLRQVDLPALPEPDE